jgi:large subunit ribosomal protein L18e
VVRRGPENIQLKNLVVFLERAAAKNKAPIWRKSAFLLAKPTRKRVEVNLFDLEKNSREGDVVLIPGKLLSEGEIKHKITVAAWRVSKAAAAKLEKAGCKLESINKLVEKNAKGKGVKLLV